MPYSNIRTPTKIRRDVIRKLRSVSISERLQSILGCLLREKWTTPWLVEIFISPDGLALGRPEDQDYFAMFLGESTDLLKDIYKVAKIAELDGDEIGYLVAKVVASKRRW